MSRKNREVQNGEATCSESLADGSLVATREVQIYRTTSHERVADETLDEIYENLEEIKLCCEEELTFDDLGEHTSVFIVEVQEPRKGEVENVEDFEIQDYGNGPLADAQR